MKIFATYCFLIGALCAQDWLSRNELGLGKHKSYDYDGWDGQKVEVSRLDKDNGLYELIRNGKDKFEIKFSNQKSEVVFRFSRDFGIALYDVKLVDIHRQNNSISALLRSGVGNYCILHASKGIMLPKGKYKTLSPWIGSADWQWTGASDSYDFQKDLDKVNGVPPKIANVKLLGPNKIEFVSEGASGNPNVLSIFVIQDGNVVKNGKNISEILTMNNTFDEDDILKEFINSSDEEIQKYLPSCSGTVEEYLGWIRKNSRSESVYAQIRERAERAFRNTSPK